jgi:hypothetical protein
LSNEKKISFRDISKSNLLQNLNFPSCPANQTVVLIEMLEKKCWVDLGNGRNAGLEFVGNIAELIKGLKK